MDMPVSVPTGAVPNSDGINLFRADPTLARLMRLYVPAALATHLQPHLDRLGALAGGRLDALAGTADRNPPVLHHRTRSGQDRQWIEKHPAYVEMERLAFGEYGLAALSHRPGVLDWPEKLPPIAKYLIVYLFVQAEFGLMCPVSMTDSLTRTLTKYGSPDLIARYLPALTSQDLDTLTQGAMFMTEQGAGSDVGATTVHAEPAADGTWRLTGDKWFCSNADADLAMVLARPAGASSGTRGLGLFLMPRTRPDGTQNAFRIIRLKAKLGTRSMASGEIRLEGALAYPVGDLTAGFRQMADMINNSRLSNGVRAAGLMRRAVSEALFVAHHRTAFGRRLVELPLMRRQLAKLLVRAEQARTMMFQTAEALRRADAGENDAYPLLRILTPLIKFRACRDARMVTGDAMEVRGGVGYIEEWPDPRLLRDSHLGSIWEGTSNIVALDVLRAARREGSLDALTRHLHFLLEDADGLPEAKDLLMRAGALVAATEDGRPALARQAASALYHLTSAVAMAWEGARTDDPSRLALARMVLRHRVLPRDPLMADDSDGDALTTLLPDPSAV